MASTARPEHLPASKLGTKEYWDNLYTTELSNNTADPSDVGTIWFDDSDAESKVLSFLSRRALLSRETTSFLDLGCGNGSMLFSLRDYEHDDEDEEEEGGWRGNMLGVDYSEQSIHLARQIASSRTENNDETIDFKQWDLLNDTYDPIVPREWDVVLDKGTFDAISLSDQNDPQGRRLCEGFKERILPLVKEGGLFLITSCNWTEPELKAWFEGDGLAFDGQVEYPSFSFGGVKGQTITTLCFRRT